MKYYELDRTHLPVIVVRFNPVDVSLNDHADFLEQQIELMQQNPDTAFVFDLTKAKPLSSELRIQQGNWNKKHEKFLKEHCKGIAFVNQSMMMGFVLKGIFLIQKPTAPYTVVSDLQEGIAWAKALKQPVNRAA